jgi:hypothetical protein
VDDYGNISLEQVRAHATEYATTETRTRQNSVQMQQCIFASLMQAFQNRVNLQKKSWYIDDQADGACLLKVMISLSYPDTPATTSHIRTELTKSDEKMIELNFDIEKFNDWVNDQVTQLVARGAQTTDLMENLFKGYEKVPDKEFLACCQIVCSYCLIKNIGGCIPTATSINIIQDRIILTTAFHNHVVDDNTNIHHVDIIRPIPIL